MDPILNCLTGVCCPPEAQAATLASELCKNCDCDDATAKKVAAWMLGMFDLAEVGTLGAYRASVARLARGPHYKA